MVCPRCTCTGLVFFVAPLRQVPEFLGLVCGDRGERSSSVPPFGELQVYHRSCSSYDLAPYTLYVRIRLRIGSTIDCYLPHMSIVRQLLPRKLNRAKSQYAPSMQLHGCCNRQTSRLTRYHVIGRVRIRSGMAARSFGGSSRCSPNEKCRGKLRLVLDSRIK